MEEHSAHRADSPRFIARRVGPIHWKEISEGWAGYAEYSAVTFVIDPVARFLLDGILAAPEGQSRDELASQLASVAENTATRELAERVELAIGILISAQLIEADSIETRRPI